MCVYRTILPPLPFGPWSGTNSVLKHPIEHAPRGFRGFNHRGNLLIADQFNNRVIEATPDGQIIWQFGLGPNDFSSNSVIGCNDAQRVGRLTLMAGSGLPPGIDPAHSAKCRTLVHNQVHMLALAHLEPRARKRKRRAVDLPKPQHIPIESL